MKYLILSRKTYTNTYQDWKVDFAGIPMDKLRAEKHKKDLEQFYADIEYPIEFHIVEVPD